MWPMFVVTACQPVTASNTDVPTEAEHEDAMANGFDGPHTLRSSSDRELHKG